MTHVLSVAAFFILLTTTLWAGFVSDPISHQFDLRESAAAQSVRHVGQSPAPSLLQNAHFTDGLAHWFVIGDVTSANDEAILGDLSVESAILYQSVAIAPDTYELSFDYRSALSDSVVPGFAPDTFFASLYFYNDPNVFDLLDNEFDHAIGLMDLDAAGAFNVVGNITPNPDHDTLD